MRPSPRWRRARRREHRVAARPGVRRPGLRGRQQRADRLRDPRRPRRRGPTSSTPIVAGIDGVQDAHPDLYIGKIGDASAEKAVDGAIGRRPKKAGILSVPITLIILLIVLGSLVAAGMPLLIGLTAVFGSLGLTAVASQFMPVSEYASAVVLLVGLAVGVDYSMFYLRRVREERAAGRGDSAALEAAAATSGRSVLISGLTVMVAMAGMFFTGDATFVSFGLATILAVAVAVLGSLTVLPALLSCSAAAWTPAACPSRPPARGPRGPVLGGRRRPRAPAPARLDRARRRRARRAGAPGAADAHRGGGHGEPARLHPRSSTPTTAFRPPSPAADPARRGRGRGRRPVEMQSAIGELRRRRWPRAQMQEPIDVTSTTRAPSPASPSRSPATARTRPPRPR